MTKHTMLIRLAVLVEIEVDPDPCEQAARIAEVLEDVIETTLSPQPDHLGYVSTSIHELEPHTMNCGRCGSCGRFTTDCERPDPIEELHRGAAVDGRLLCDECLPEDHPWQF